VVYEVALALLQLLNHTGGVEIRFIGGSDTSYAGMTIFYELAYIRVK
jgi:hypothetical protein